MIQISTVSIAGENVGGKFPQEKKLYESELYFGQSLSNKYIDTKFRAEKAVLEAFFCHPIDSSYCLPPCSFAR